MSWLPWIENSDLEREVLHLLKVAGDSKKVASKTFGKNVIDPFAALFEMSGFNLDFESWIISETNRQAQKTLQNHIGNFHQNILGITSGWENKGVGNVIDLFSPERKIIAEVKNKYNTISGGKLSDLYESLDRHVSQKNSKYYGFIAYYVAIIPKNGIRYDRPFTPSNKEKGARCPINENIREIDGASFYHLVTGSENALGDLFTILPEVIKTCTNGAYIFNNVDKLKSYFNSAYK